MFIQTETTPNPATLKFMPGKEVMASGTAVYTDKSQASNSPLAQALFTIKGVTGVFFGSDFVTVTKGENEQWDVLKPEILTTIMEHFVAGKPVIGEAGSATAAQEEAVADTELSKQIKELIDTRVRPAVAMDGGDIIFRGFDEGSGIVKLELHGSCSGCPSSTVTLRNGIENMLKHYVPEVVAVEAVA